MAIIRAHNRGFTIFFATLVASLALSVGVVIYDLLIRSLALSQVATQSQYAVYAADAGAECALYWDLNFNDTLPSDLDQSAFATATPTKMATADTGASVSAGTVVCNSQDIVAASSITNFKNTVSNSNVGWQIDYPANGNPYYQRAATTTFWFSLGTTAASPCAMVEVGKAGNPSQTTILSHGFNTCTASILKLERTLMVNY